MADGNASCEEERGEKIDARKLEAIERSVDRTEQSPDTGPSNSKDVESQTSEKACEQQEKPFSSPLVTKLFAEAVRCCAREDVLSVNDMLNFRETCKECAEAFKSMDDDVFRKWASDDQIMSTMSLEDAMKTSMLPEEDLKLVVGTRRGRFDEFSCVLAGMFTHGASRLGELRRAETPGRGKLGDIWELVQEKGERDADAVTAAVAEMRRREGAKSREERMAMYRANGGDPREGIRDAFLRDPEGEEVGLREVIAIRKLCNQRVCAQEFHALQSTRSDVESVLVDVGRILIRRHRLCTRFREVVNGTEDIVAILDTPNFSDFLADYAASIVHARPPPRYHYRSHFRYRDEYDDYSGGDEYTDDEDDWYDEEYE